MQPRLVIGYFHGDHGFDSLGAFVDGSGQVRKTASHLLQIIALTTADTLHTSATYQKKTTYVGQYVHGVVQALAVRRVACEQ